MELTGSICCVLNRYLRAAARAFGGFSFDFELEAILRPPSGDDIALMASDPLGAIKAGILIRAQTTLPFGIGAASFYGILSPQEFVLNATCFLDVTSKGSKPTRPRPCESLSGCNMCSLPVALPLMSGIRLHWSQIAGFNFNFSAGMMTTQNDDGVGYSGFKAFLSTCLPSDIQTQPAV